MIAVNVAALQHQVFIFYLEFLVFPELSLILDDDDDGERLLEPAAQ